jgi:hypothetical protein
MKAKELKEDIYNKLVSINYSRKENYISEVNSIDYNSLDSELKEVIESFPIRVIDSDIDLMGIEDLDREQQFYVFHTEGQAYLVDTQGYTYPRYIVKLDGLEDVTADDYNDFSEESWDSMEWHRMDGLIRIADDQIFNAVVKSLVFELREEDFSQKDILNFLQFKLDMAIEAASK